MIARSTQIERQIVAFSLNIYLRMKESVEEHESVDTDVVEFLYDIERARKKRAQLYRNRNFYRLFDFGRSTVNAGTYRFKRQWGAEPDQLRWHYTLPPGAEMPELNPQSPRFRLATRVWQRLPLSVANALGPRIVKNLP